MVAFIQVITSLLSSKFSQEGPRARHDFVQHTSLREG